MSQSFVSTPAAADRVAELCHDFGLAAVAAALKVKIDTLEPEEAEAVSRGAAALFLAGYGPRRTRARARLPSGEAARARRSASRAAA